PPTIRNDAFVDTRQPPEQRRHLIARIISGYRNILKDGATETDSSAHPAWRGTTTRQRTADLARIRAEPQGRHRRPRTTRERPGVSPARPPTWRSTLPPT